ncbi:MAG TPA: tRNA pseudouridine(38-40) synthase TruA [Actinomycetota bacterium]|nr:tRNA pseudouridine(38-40) synthase TruA [Actinomycetota bacterium]
MNLRLDVAYDGAPFRGFARQPDVRTVQGDLEEALSKLCGAELSTVGAGRTDAGVHALGQVVSVFGVPDDLDPVKIRDSLNSMLHPAIAVSECRSVPEDFNARFGALSRAYVYGILQRRFSDPFLAPTVLFHPEPLDVEAMNEAAGHLVGAHDFSSFGRLPHSDAPAERVLYELRVRRDGDLIRVRARANAFLQQMVRSLVGTLIQVGEGRRSPEEMPQVLEARDRSAAGPVVVPQGLCLVSVEYPDGWSGTAFWPPARETGA